MKKQDLIIIAALFALWIAWPTIDRTIIRKHIFHQEAAPAAEMTVEGAVPPAEASLADPEAVAPATAEAAVAAPAAVSEAAAVPEETDREPVNTVPEQSAILENAKVRIRISSYGATIRSAELVEYRETNDADSAPVHLDFSAAPALVYEGLDGLTVDHSFELEMLPGTQTARFERVTASGLRLTREIVLGDHYMINVRDVLSNDGAEAVEIGVHRLLTGEMKNMDGPATRGLIDLGSDTLALGGEGVKHWGKSLPKWFKTEMKDRNLPKLPASIAWPLEIPVDWVSAKNRYFVQILTPEGGADECIVHARREILPDEAIDPNFKPKSAVIESVWAALELPQYTLEPGDSFARNIQFYVGPKKYSELNLYGMHLVDVMEFGMWAPIGKILLRVLTWIHDHIWPYNYGLAIMLLTIIIRILFWPVTHKSTESMKRMQEIQPLVAEVREKYKDNAQRQQKEIMALYKEHKVNPLGGCLPMIIQIPVFIALFVVLRSAIELRFAPFLWIHDLSQPENLFAGVLPIPLNILPLIMSGTMVWQQQLTPSSGDPNQKKMMMFMPVMMLFIFYKFAAGLVLYWTTNQCLMIIQQLLMKRKQKQKQKALA